MCGFLFQVPLFRKLAHKGMAIFQTKKIRILGLISREDFTFGMLLFCNLIFRIIFILPDFQLGNVATTNFFLSQFRGISCKIQFSVISVSPCILCF